MIQGYARHSPLPRMLYDCGVIGPFESDFRDVNRTPTLGSEDPGRAKRQPLVEKNFLHATRLSEKDSSSTVAAA